MAKQNPVAVINWKVYRKGTFLGAATVELPKLVAQAIETKGSGIYGVIKSAILGTFDGMESKIGFSAFAKDQLVLLETGDHELEVRVAIQNRAGGKPGVNQLKVVMLAENKTTDLGKIEVAAAQDNAYEFFVHYIKVFLDGAEVLEYDPKGVYVVNGKNMLADVSKAID